MTLATRFSLYVTTNLNCILRIIEKVDEETFLINYIFNATIKTLQYMLEIFIWRNFHAKCHTRNTSILTFIPLHYYAVSLICHKSDVSISHIYDCISIILIASLH